MASYKIGSVVRGVYDRTFTFNDRIWIPENRDRFSLISDDVPAIGLRIMADGRMVLGAVNPPVNNLFNPGTFRAFNSDQQARLNLLAGYPFHIGLSIRGDFDRTTASFPSYSVSIIGWLNRVNLSGFIQLADYRGEDLMLPSDLIRSDDSNTILFSELDVPVWLIFNSVPAQDEVLDRFRQNDTENVAPYAVTSAGRMDTDGQTQSGILVPDIGDRETLIVENENGPYFTLIFTFEDLPAIETNTTIPIVPNRNTDIDMRIISSLVEPQIVNQNDNSIIARSRHVIIATIYDRSAYRLSDTPLRLTGNVADGAFEIPENSGRFYNLVEFIETEDERLTLTFESV